MALTGVSTPIASRPSEHGQDPPALAPDLVVGLRRLKLAKVRAIAPEVLITAKTQTVGSRGPAANAGGDRAWRWSSVGSQGTRWSPAPACRSRGAEGGARDIASGARDFLIGVALRKSTSNRTASRARH